MSVLFRNYSGWSKRNLYSITNKTDSIYPQNEIDYKANILNDYAKANGYLKGKDKSFDGSDVREGLTAIISLQIPEDLLQFEGQTKAKLGTPVARTIVESITSEKLKYFLEENKTVATGIINKALKGKEAPNASVKKQLRAELKQLEERITNEIKTQVKTEFNYQIPIAEVEKAGISTTGATIENELEPLAIEFKKYREANQLWTKHSKEIHYQIAENEIQRIRVVDGITSEPEVF